MRMPVCQKCWSTVHLKSINGVQTLYIGFGLSVFNGWMSL